VLDTWREGWSTLGETAKSPEGVRERPQGAFEASEGVFNRPEGVLFSALLRLIDLDSAIDRVPFFH
jgi:hypothetical protein